MAGGGGASFAAVAVDEPGCSDRLGVQVDYPLAADARGTRRLRARPADGDGDGAAALRRCGRRDWSAADGAPSSPGVTRAGNRQGGIVSGTTVFATCPFVPCFSPARLSPAPQLLARAQLAVPPLRLLSSVERQASRD